MNAITITRAEAIILAQALNEVCNGPDSIDEREFHTRMGATRDEALEILIQISKLIDSSRP